MAAAVTAVACFSSAALAATASAAAGTGWISGKVTDASTLAGIAGIEVCAEETVGEFFRCVDTDAQGEYKVPELGTANYKVEFWPPSPDLLNYAPQYYDGKSSWGEATPVHVNNGLGTTGINAALVKGGWIEGRVTDAVSKVGLAETLVCASPIDEAGFGRCAYTDPSGGYALHGLIPEAYEVGFFPEDGDHLGQFYDGKANWFEATPVTVTAGSGRAGIDAELARAGHIAGTVTDSVSGAGIPFVPVCLVDAEGEPELCVRAGSTGRYAFDALPTGAYRVRFSPDNVWPEEEDDYFEQYYNAKAGPAQADLVGVTAPNTTTGVDARLVSRKAQPSAQPPSPPGAQPQPPATHPPKPQQKPKKARCRHGFKRTRVHGKKRCVRIRHHRPRHHR
ncbi:MAG TPA: carboxypeptidase-like regulatory domain-containing protein [Solirubrobacterales bacterium]|nr:carboxypeptidase-like regulatory domain-containing protein [Solirubrobacterales bacterium]